MFTNPLPPSHFSNIKNLASLYDHSTDFSSSCRSCCHRHHIYKSNVGALDKLQNFWANYRDLYHANEELKNKVKILSQKNSWKNKGMLDIDSQFGYSSMGKFKNRNILSELNGSYSSGFNNCHHHSHDQCGEGVSWKLQKTQQAHHSEQILILQKEIDSLHLHLKTSKEENEQLQKYIKQLEIQNDNNTEMILNKLRQAKRLEGEWREKYEAIFSENKCHLEELQCTKSHLCKAQSQNSHYVSYIEELKHKINRIGTQCCSKITTVSHGDCYSSCHTHSGCHH